MKLLHTNASQGSSPHARRVLAILVVCCCAFAAFAAAASASYEEIGSFAGNGAGPGGSGGEDGQLSNPGEAAVNDATGSLYVADTGNNRVEVFKPTAAGGEYESQAAIAEPTGLAIDQASGDVYVAGPAGIAKLDAGLAPVGGWTDPGASGPLAVDPSTGDLLVADTGANLVRRFEADGTPAGTFAAERPISVAVDSSGQVYVVTSTGDIYGCASSSLHRFSAAGADQGEVAALEAPGNVAVDPDNDAIAVATKVNQYNCGGSPPQLVFFDALGTETDRFELPLDTTYATVSGLAAAGGGSPRLYAVTKSPFNDFFGATKITALQLIVPTAPTLSAQSAQPRATEATLKATINPGNAATRYRFEFGPTSAYGRTSAEKTLAAGKQDVAVATDVFGLEPGATYHFRVVLTNSVGTVTGEDLTFNTTSVGGAGDSCPNAAARAAQGSTFLANCRAYERVSPQDKNGNDVNPGRAQASLDGNGLAYTSAGAFGDAESSTVNSRYVAFRGANGWTSRSVMPQLQNDSLTSDGVDQFSDDLTMSVAKSRPISEVNSEARYFFRRETLSGQSQLMSPRPNGSTSNIFEGIGSTDDLSHYVFVSEHALQEGDPPQDGAYYLYEGYVENGESKLRLIRAGGVPGASVAFMDNAISADGSRIFYTAPGTQNSIVGGRILMAENGSTSVEVSASQLGTPEAEHRAAFFMGAAPDGSRVLFGSAERLNAESNSDGRETTSLDFGDLYLYDVESGGLTDISSSAPSGGHALGVLGVSDDLGTVYFVDRAVLAAGGVAGQPNVYVWERGMGVTYIGTLDDPADQTTWLADGPNGPQASVSADGSGLVFQSRAALGGYDPNGHVGIYYFRRDSRSLTCVSCRNDGPTKTDGQLIEPLNANLPHHRARFVSDDGDRVFFTSGDSLAARDTNGVRDVYEWNAAAGTASLISSGQGESNAYFLDASPSGEDVFFITRQQLVGSDTDSLMDVYDARVGGGLPEPAGAAPACVDEACRPSSSAPPAAAAPASSAFSAPSSASSKRARCVKPRKRGGKAGAKKRAKGQKAKAGARARAGKKTKKPHNRKSCRGGRS